MDEAGLLVIWSDIAPSEETDYLHWLTREHTSERVSTDGFLGVRVFRALGVEARRYLIVYTLESPAALAGPDYLGKLDRPTPWTQRIMPRLQNFIRGGGRVAAEAGVGGGGIVAPIIFWERLPEDGAAVVEALAREDRIAAARLLETDKERTTIRTREKAMRTGDRTFAGVLLVEGLDEAAVKHALRRAPALAADATLYAQVFSLLSPRASGGGTRGPS
jgi:hypothetical protein